MTPRLAVSNIADCGLAHIEFTRQRSDAFAPCQSLQDQRHRLLRQLCLAAGAAARHQFGMLFTPTARASLCRLVTIVCRGRPRKQVLRFAARRSVTGVADHLIVRRKTAVSVSVCQSVSFLGLAPPAVDDMRELSVAITIAQPRPVEALTIANEHGEEPLLVGSPMVRFRTCSAAVHTTPSCQPDERDYKRLAATRADPLCSTLRTHRSFNSFGAGPRAFAALRGHLMPAIVPAFEWVK